jgi:hypothetical protein
LLMVKRVLSFLLNLLSSFLDARRRRLVLSELQNTLTEQKTFMGLLDLIEDRINDDEYKISDCTFEGI